MSKQSSNNEKLRKRIWSDVPESILWMSNQRVGFTQVPRGLGLVNRILDKLSVGKPVSATYIALWCSLYDNAVVRIEGASSAAFEAGFSGPRAVTTWKSRIKVLETLGFIKTAPGAAGDYTYILMIDPYQVLVQLEQKGSLKEFAHEFNALMERLEKVASRRPSVAPFPVPPPPLATSQISV